jgi:hypothetical protein
VSDPTSATGGYLRPTQSPLYGQLLDQKIHTYLRGVTGLDDIFIRPMWQANPPQIPDINVTWLAFGVTDIQSDQYPHQQQATLTAKSVRRELLTVSCISYGFNAAVVVSRIRGGMAITQNQEALQLLKMACVDVGDIRHVPELINNRYFDRYDTSITLARDIELTYNILPFTASEGIISDDGVLYNFEVVANGAGS